MNDEKKNKEMNSEASDSYAEVHVSFLATENGGRKGPVHLDDQGYMPHFRILGDNEYLGVVFVDGPDEPVKPGQSTNATVRFLYWPNLNYEKLGVGREFQILEGPNVVGNGKVLRK